MKVLVCGGRRYDDWPRLRETLDRLHAEHGFSLVIHGAAAGADRLAGSWAQGRGVQEVICPANWQRHGTAAGPRRNRAMLLLKPELVVAFPGGRGTGDMVCAAMAADVNVIQVSADSTNEPR